MPTENALDVLNTALGEVQPDANADAPADDAVGDEGVVAEGGDEAALGDAGEAGESGEQGGEGAGEVSADGEGGEGEPSLAEQAAALGISTRDNGRFKSHEQLAAEIAAAKAAGSGAAKPGAKEGGASGDGKAASKKEPDAVNDPISKDLKPETQARIRTLIDRTKGAEERATVAEQNFNYLVEGVKATGASPEQYGETLSWLALFNSQDPKQQSQALEIIEDVADRLATMLGVERKIADPLAAHPDLQLAVKQGQINAQLAKEVARQRNQGAFRAQMQTAHVNQQRTEQQQFEQARESARTSLNELEATLRATDPNYERKKTILMPKLKQEFASAHPTNWVATFQKLYREVKVAPAPRAVVGQRPGVPNNQPLRANKTAGAGGGASLNTANQPKSGMDALNAALAAFSGK